MNTPRAIRTIAILLFISDASLALALGDPAYGPCILNGYSAPISFVATFSDGSSSPGSLPPGSAAWQRIKNRHLRSLSVTPTGASKRVYRSITLDELRRQHGFRDEVWVVTERGIRLEDRRQIAVVRKLLAQPRK